MCSLLFVIQILKWKQKAVKMAQLTFDYSEGLIMLNKLILKCAAAESKEDQKNTNSFVTTHNPLAFENILIKLHATK